MGGGLAHGRVAVPAGRPSADWALLGSGVELRRTDYDIAAGCVTLAAHGRPGIEGWLDHYVRQTYSDAEALAVFGPRDGRTTP